MEFWLTCYPRVNVPILSDLGRGSLAVHIPPNFSREFASKILTSKPESRHWHAAPTPVIPAPIIATLGRYDGVFGDAHPEENRLLSISLAIRRSLRKSELSVCGGIKVLDKATMDARWCEDSENGDYGERAGDLRRSLTKYAPCTVSAVRNGAGGDLRPEKRRRKCQ